MSICQTTNSQTKIYRVTICKTIGIFLATATTLFPQDNPSSSPSAAFQSPHGKFDAGDRFRWVVLATLGPKNLAAGVFVAGIQTWRNQPEEYGPHWEGFADRYGVRLAAGGTSNAIEASIGSLWGEDPRYFRAAGEPMKTRLGHVVKMAFVTHNRDGDEQLAYARFIAVPGGALLTNTWRPDSPTTVRHVSVQVGLGFVSRIVGNAFSEFFPDVTARLGRRHQPTGP